MGKTDMSQNSQHVEIETFKKRTGLLQVRVKSNHMIRCKDGVVRQYEVRNADSGLYKDCSKVVVCLSTNQSYENYGALVAASPTNDVMRRNEQSLIWAYWSEDTEDYLRACEDAEREYQIAKGKDEKAKKRVVPRAEPVDYSKIIGLLAESQE